MEKKVSVKPKKNLILPPEKTSACCQQRASLEAVVTVWTEECAGVWLQRRSSDCPGKVEIKSENEIILQFQAY